MSLTRNPVLKDDTFRSQGPFLDRGIGGDPFGGGRSDTMTLAGVLTKSAILLALVATTFLVSWNMTVDSSGASSGSLPLLMGAGVLAFGLSLVISFKPKLAPVLAPVFALAEGLVLGAVSALYEYEATFGNSVPSGYDGIVFQAALGTTGVFAAMLVLYRTRLITVTDRFRSIITTAMLGIVLVYVISFVMSFFGATIPLIHESGPVGIIFSLVVIGIASMMLLVDFDMIEGGVAAGAPKYMEWYSAFALLVTIVWIYLEMLRLLSKLRGR